MFLAENDGEALESEALRLGASDYALMRPNGCDALASRIRLRMAERRTAPAEWLLSGKTILVAEDAELNREIIAAMLAAVTGLTVHFAENGSQAAEMFKNNPDGYAMVFMDIHMPVTDGLAATRAIRAMGLERSVSIPIIALSAADGEEEIEACSDAGMNGFLLKPMDYEEFLGVCGKFLVV